MRRVTTPMRGTHASRAQTSHEPPTFERFRPLRAPAPRSSRLRHQIPAPGPDRSLLTELEEIFRLILTAHGATLTEFNGEPDHVHLLITYPPALSVGDMARYLKGRAPKPPAATVLPTPIRPLDCRVFLRISRRCAVNSDSAVHPESRPPPLKTRERYVTPALHPRAKARGTTPHKTDSRQIDKRWTRQQT